MIQKQSEVLYVQCTPITVIIVLSAGSDQIPLAREVRSVFLFLVSHIVRTVILLIIVFVVVVVSIIIKTIATSCAAQIVEITLHILSRGGVDDE